ncbi:Molybdenum cofactor biosynthesis protein B [Pseudobythopirellula maris]|uniref:Molybdenum cofactor biosynthesis protein B n=1 Tax=Pseudobythopirellula maris TaxID=2527991 RepID=A0A5C5ZTW9_9BACT|nr:molybdenum cofactor biosynthesis protein B [Pseudobythopirellula maris]TWT91014.1 Molybdenum cofactor biosynthesis protein B [Pseudobythopirellula maris]
MSPPTDPSKPAGTPPQQHRREAPEKVRCAVVTVSDTRTEHNDRGGNLLAELLTVAGHEVALRRLTPDEPGGIRALVLGFADDPSVDAVLLTGGTGIAARDQTCETLEALFDKPLPGYGEIFRALSYEEIGPAAMLSRATGGVARRTVVLSMPGSPAAVRLAVEKLIGPELGHLVREATR